MPYNRDVSLADQLAAATEMDACFCIACGQPDETHLHDPARCPQGGGKRDEVTIARALSVYDEAVAEEPDLEDAALALWCIIVAIRSDGPSVGDGTGDAAIAIGEEAFRAGFAWACGPNGIARGTVDEGWSAYEPSEAIKALS